jgi:hypothetical protein
MWNIERLRGNPFGELCVLNWNWNYAIQIPVLHLFCYVNLYNRDIELCIVLDWHVYKPRTLRNFLFTFIPSFVITMWEMRNLLLLPIISIHIFFDAFQSTFCDPDYLPELFHAVFNLDYEYWSDRYNWL